MTPTSRRKTQRQPDTTRKRLVAAAGEIIVERGFDGAGIIEILQRADLTNGALYAHFSTKNELLAAALCEEIAPLRALVAELDATPGDVVSKFSTLMRAWRQVVPRNAGVLTEACARARRDDVVRGILLTELATIEDAYVRWIKIGQKDGHLRKSINPRAFARLICSTGLGYQIQDTVGRAPIREDIWVELLVGMIESIGSPPPSPPKDLAPPRASRRQAAPEGKPRARARKAPAS